MDHSGSIQSKLKCNRFVKYETEVDSLAHMQAPKHGKECTRQNSICGDRRQHNSGPACGQRLS